MAGRRKRRGLQGPHGLRLRRLRAARRRDPRSGDRDARERPQGTDPPGIERQGRTLTASLDTPLREHDEEGTPQVLSELSSIFGNGGALARRLPGFAFRAHQLEVAEAIARTIAGRRRLIDEAGTGAGRTCPSPEPG